MGGYIMNVHVYDSAKTASRAAATLFAAQLLRKPDSVFGFATGSTPIETYKYLAKWHEKGLLDFSDAVSFNLDEYVGLSAQDEASYAYFMRENLFDHINLKASWLPNGKAEDLQQECARYDAAIREMGGIDLQFLGIGRNGHIGFNEPADTFVVQTQIVDLTEDTIDANARFFDSMDQVPRQAVSMGIGAIMHARSIVLVALGENKAEAIKQMLYGDITPQLPASILRTHPNTVVILDREAASLL